MSHRRRWGAVRAGLVLVPIVIAGCGDSENIDVVDLAGRLPGLIAADHPEVVTNVVCPDEIERSAGSVAQCRALLSGDPIAVTVTQLDGDGAVSVSIDVAPLVVEQLADDLAAQLTEDLDRDVVVSCAGPGLIVPEADETVSCTATDEAGTRTLTVTLLDDRGAYAVRFS